MTNITNRRNGADVIVGEYYTSYDAKLDVRVNDEWVDALLSGAYEQGKRMLVTPEGKFCCLGVYCERFHVPSILKPRDVPTLDGNDIRNVQVRVFGGVDISGAYGSFTFIPSGFAPALFNKDGNEIASFFGSEPVFEIVTQGHEGEFELEVTPSLRPRTLISLPDLNDQGFTFTQIADVIRYFL